MVLNLVPSEKGGGGASSCFADFSYDGELGEYVPESSFPVSYGGESNAHSRGMSSTDIQLFSSGSMVCSDLPPCALVVMYIPYVFFRD